MLHRSLSVMAPASALAEAVGSTHEICSGAHISRGNTYHCNTGSTTRETGYDSMDMSRKINSHFILTHGAASMQEYRRWNLFALVDVDLATKWLARALHYSNFTEAKNGWELNVPAQIK